MRKWTLRLLAGLAALVLLTICALAGYRWLALPKLDGSLSPPGLSKSVSIKRDAADVTHIEAQSDRDAAFAVGYVHAQERGWQLEFNRRILHGRLSEFLGDATLETDKLMRTLGILQAAQAQFANLPPAVKDELQAYADGVNAFHASAGQALPPEFHVLGIKPGIWTPQDTMAWGIMMALDLGGNWGTELARANAARVLPTERVWQLFPVYEGEKPKATADIAKLYQELGLYKTAASQPAKTTKSVATNVIKTVTAGSFGIKNRLLSSLEGGLADLADRIGHGDAQATGLGSNNWVVAGSHTASGKPIVANDPHLGLSAPAIWYYAAVKTPNSQVIGATLPGSPYVVLGRNARVAWGFTNTGPDVQDLYIERIDANNPKRYQTPDGWADFTERKESIGVKGKAAVEIAVRSTRHGPVLSDSLKAYDWVDTAKFAVSLRWSALDADNLTIASQPLLAKAANVTELFAAFAGHHTPMQNVVAADVDGGVGYKAVGKLPLRGADNDFAGLAPAPGWDAKYDWQGWLPYADTPFDDGKTSNRRAASAKGASELAQRGWLATANQRIHDPAYPHFMGQDWGADYRQRRIEALLQAVPKHDPASAAKIHGDITSLAVQRLMPHFLAAIDASATGAVPDNFKAAAKTWDGNMAADSALPLVFAAWLDQFARDVLPHRLGQARFDAQYGRRQFRAAIENILETNDLFYCKKDVSGSTADCKAASSNAINLAIANLRLRLGDDTAKWQWGHEHRAISKHNPFGNVPALAKWFDVAVPTAGDSFTVNVGQHDFKDKTVPFANRHAASMRAIYDFADLERSQFIYQTGQSGLVFSSRYRNMSSEWAAVQYRPLQLKPAGYVHQLQLNPGR